MPTCRSKRLPMKLRFLIFTIVFLIPIFAIGASNKIKKYHIVTGPERSSTMQMGQDLATLLGEDLNFDALPSTGSAENVKRLFADNGVLLALVQSDFYQALQQEALNGSSEAKRMAQGLRVVMPLNTEELYFVVRTNSPINYVHEIKNKRINVGPLGSGGALSATMLYRKMFGYSINEKNISYLDNESALLKLATDSSIDVVVIVESQPAKIFAEMKPEAKQYIKLLQLQKWLPESKEALSKYRSSTILASSYPDFLTEDVEAFSTESLLMTIDAKSDSNQQVILRFAQSICQKMGLLKKDGHAKWKELSSDLVPSSTNWTYYLPTKKILTNCPGNTLPNTSKPIQPANSSSSNCTQNSRVLGLCQ
jgi:uncharacterized protein